MSARRCAALVLAAVLLAGCQDEPEPEFDPTPTASPSESESSEEPAVQPAEEFIAEWVRLQRDMQNTGNTTEFRAVSPRCKACLDLADLVTRYYDAGGYVKTRGWTVRSLSQRSRSGNTIEFEADIASAATTYVERANGPKERIPAGRGRELFVVRKVDDEWHMLEIAELAR